MKRLHHSSVGFTLIEVLVTTTIIAFMLGGGIVAFLGFRNRQIVLGDAKRLQQLMVTARTKARAGDTPATCTRLQGYQVSTTPGAESPEEIELYAVCDSGNVLITTETLSSGVTTSASFSVQFMGLRGGATGSTLFTIERDNLMYEFEVTGSGTIDEGSFIDSSVEGPSER